MSANGKISFFFMAEKVFPFVCVHACVYACVRGSVHVCMAACLASCVCKRVPECLHAWAPGFMGACVLARVHVQPCPSL